VETQRGQASIPGVICWAGSRGTWDGSTRRQCESYNSERTDKRHEIAFLGVSWSIISSRPSRSVNLSSSASLIFTPGKPFTLKEMGGEALKSHCFFPRSKNFCGILRQLSGGNVATWDWGVEVDAEKTVQRLAPSSPGVTVRGGRFGGLGASWGERDEFGVIPWADCTSGLSRKNQYRYSRSSEVEDKSGSGVSWGRSNSSEATEPGLRGETSGY